MWEDLIRALALVLVVEGLLPFAAPARWREALLAIAHLEDRTLRVLGFGSMLAGILALQFA